MVTVQFNIKPYLARYMYVRYRQSLEPDPENQSHSSSPSSSKTAYPYPSLPHYSSLSLPSSTICPSSAKYFMERNWKYLLCTAQTA